MARLLFVDDEPAMLFALQRLAEKLKHEPVLARSGAEALSRLEGVDAVITDYSMPEMDGVQLTQAIRERDESLPVILLTAHGSERVAVRAMKSGAYEYVTKPFEIDEISLVIDRAVEPQVTSRALIVPGLPFDPTAANASAPLARIQGTAARVWTFWTTVG